MIATDINSHALVTARGLDLLMRERFKDLPAADIISHDINHLKTPLVIESEIKQICAFPFRLTSILNLDNLERVGDIIRISSFCVMHFFSDCDETITSLEKGYGYTKISKASIEQKEVEVTCISSSKTGSQLIVWDKENLTKFIQKKGGDIVEICEFSTPNDMKKWIKFWICIVRKIH